ncbi:hypothetical protein [Cerasicoccus arenae]|uniref:Uncharacterized protein n=1 Tax=Cerasicoccus arenae TaxID=424488 RepID=A0A8J3DH44_9BACT|nr:hypothetical protein [Cerasicoccus arenae]MBK1858029.1 hypothetical protein [Cerasicoccus arenae]GHC06608.1 hypothetical protein GCM10007047_24520 [Cerasicoccus arenae]
MAESDLVQAVSSGIDMELDGIPPGLAQGLEELIDESRQLQEAVLKTKSSREWTFEEKQEIVSAINRLSKDGLLRARELRIQFPGYSDGWLGTYGDVMYYSMNNNANALMLYIMSIEAGGGDSKTIKNIQELVNVMVLNFPESGAVVSESMQRRYVVLSDSGRIEESDRSTLIEFGNGLSGITSNGLMSSDMPAFQGVRAWAERRYARLLAEETRIVESRLMQMASEAERVAMLADRRIKYENAVAEFENYIDSVDSAEEMGNLNAILLQMKELKPHRSLFISDGIKTVPGYEKIKTKFPDSSLGEVYQGYFSYALFKNYSLIKEDLEKSKYLNNDVNLLFLSFFVSDKLGADGADYLKRILEIDPENRMASSFLKSVEESR